MPFAKKEYKTTEVGGPKEEQALALKNLATDNSAVVADTTANFTNQQKVEAMHNTVEVKSMVNEHAEKNKGSTELENLEWAWNDLAQKVPEFLEYVKLRAEGKQDDKLKMEIREKAGLTTDEDEVRLSEAHAAKMIEKTAREAGFSEEVIKQFTDEYATKNRDYELTAFKAVDSLRGSALLATVRDISNNTIQFAQKKREEVEEYLKKMSSEKLDKEMFMRDVEEVKVVDSKLEEQGKKDEEFLKLFQTNLKNELKEFDTKKAEKLEHIENSKPHVSDMKLDGMSPEVANAVLKAYKEAGEQRLAIA